MFSVSGVSVEVTVAIPGNAPAIDQNTTGATHQLEVLNYFTVPIDIDVLCGTSAGMLTFGSGPTWTRLVGPISKQLTVWGNGFKIYEPISKPPGAGLGSEVVACNRLKYRFTGAPGWNPDHYPTSGHEVMVNVA